LQESARARERVSRIERVANSFCSETYRLAVADCHSVS